MDKNKHFKQNQHRTRVVISQQIPKPLLAISNRLPDDQSNLQKDQNAKEKKNQNKQCKVEEELEDSQEQKQQQMYNFLTNDYSKVTKPKQQEFKLRTPKDFQYEMQMEKIKSRLTGIMEMEKPLMELSEIMENSEILNILGESKIDKSLKAARQFRQKLDKEAGSIKKNDQGKQHNQHNRNQKYVILQHETPNHQFISNHLQPQCNKTQYLITRNFYSDYHLQKEKTYNSHENMQLQQGSHIHNYHQIENQQRQNYEPKEKHGQQIDGPKGREIQFEEMACNEQKIQGGAPIIQKHQIYHPISNSNHLEKGMLIQNFFVKEQTNVRNCQNFIPEYQAKSRQLNYLELKREIIYKDEDMEVQYKKGSDFNWAQSCWESQFLNKKTFPEEKKLPMVRQRGEGLSHYQIYYEPSETSSRQYDGVNYERFE